MRFGDPRPGTRLVWVWLLSCAVSVAVAAAGYFIGRWSTCSYHPGDPNCLERILYVNLYFYAAALIIFLAMTLYVILAARRRAKHRRE